MLAAVDWFVDGRARGRPEDRRLRLRRGGPDRPLRRGARHADRRRRRQRLFRRPARALARADRPQRLRPAGAVRRRRDRQPDRAAAADRRGREGPRGDDPLRKAAAPGPAHDARARDGQRRGGPGARRSSRASSRRPGSTWSSAATTARARSARPTRSLRSWLARWPRARRSLPDRRRRRNRSASGLDPDARQSTAGPRDRPPQPAAPRREPVRPPGLSSASSTPRRSTPSRRRSSPTATAFRDDVIGRFDDPLLPPDPRSRKVYDEPKFTGYEVVLDVFPDVIAYGILLVPKGIKDGERRPVVVCQHGLEGRPQDVADPKVDNPSTTSSPRPARRAEGSSRSRRRTCTSSATASAPSSARRTRSRRRSSRSSSPSTSRSPTGSRRCPFVDPARIGFYGLSYGGKSAMRIPAAGPELLPVDLLGRLQRVGRQERVDPLRRTATSGRPSTRSSSGTSAARSTTPRWPR